MRRIQSSVVLMSITAISIIIGACATAEPVDGDLNGVGQETSPTLPKEPEVKLPETNPQQSKPADAGAKDSSTKDSAPTAPVDSGPPANTGDCDPNDPLIIIKLLTVQNPAPCPCSASECCFQAVCLPN